MLDERPAFVYRHDMVCKHCRYIFDHVLVLPEYIVEFRWGELLTTLTPPLSEGACVQAADQT